MEGLFILFATITAIQIFYLLFIFRRISSFRDDSMAGVSQPISVVICARNESVRLEKNLSSILEQDYPDFEVVLVNDNSDDDTELLLRKLSVKYPKLTVRNIVQDSNIMRGKKYPLTIGIRAAANETVLLTDADCVPSSDKWIAKMAASLADKKEIVLGYAPYRKYPTFLNKFIRFETFFTALQYLSYALYGIPYMGVGRNLAYRKKIFFQHNIFPKYTHLLSGDDDLLINKAATRRNTSIQVSQEAFMYSEPKKTWEEYWEQKQRHVSTGRYYRAGHQLLLGLFSLTHLLFYCTFLLAVIYSSFQLAALLLFIFRLVIQGIVFYGGMKKLGEDDLFPWYPVMDILFLIYYFKLVPGLFQTKAAAWK